MFKFKKKAGINYTGSSENLKKNYDILKIINNRFIGVFIVAVLLMSVLAVRLYTIQIVNAAHYETLLATYSTNYLSSDSQRGDIYDRNGVLMASSTKRNVITYSKATSLTDKQYWELAYKFIDHFTVSLDAQTKDDLQVLYINLHLDELKKIVDPSITAAYSSNKIDAGAYTAELKKLVSDTMLETITLRQRTAYVVKQIIDTASSNSFNIVLDNATDTEIAYFAEHVSEYPGFIYLQDWDRKYDSAYVNGIIGGITSSAQGLLAESSEYYQALGYSLNSRMGRSGLESQYESLLSGTKTQYQAVISDSGYVVYQEVSEGSKGLTLHTSLDLVLQAEIETMVINWMKSQEGVAGRKDMNRVNLVVQKPGTGELLALVSMVRNADGTYENDPTGVFTNAFLGGSIVKGATLYTAFNEGVVTTSDIVVDQVWKIKGTRDIKSWRILGPIGYLDSLALSSNVFMWEMGVRLAGGKYVANEELSLPNLSTAFQELRNTFSQFGLGTQTQVDFPNEAIGYTGTTDRGSDLLDMVIGQYESYTPIQLSQYISTIANDGVRLKPRLVLNATDPVTNQIVWQNNNEVLNTLSNPVALKNVQDGFRYCVSKRSDGLCNRFDAGLPSKVEMYAKTGTAQTYLNGAEYWNHNAISYTKINGTADISLVCGVPYSTSAAANLSSPCEYLTNQVYRMYYKGQ